MPCCSRGLASSASLLRFFNVGSRHAVHLVPVVRRYDRHAVDREIFVQKIERCACARATATYDPRAYLVFHRFAAADKVNEFTQKAKSADAFIFGSPVYYASANGAFVAFLDRAFSEIFRSEKFPFRSLLRSALFPLLSRRGKYSRFRAGENAFSTTK